MKLERAKADSIQPLPALASDAFSILSMAAQPPATGGSRKISFNVSDQYDIQDVIGEGAYGVVW